MAVSFTNYGENKFMDALLRGQALGAPGTWYVGLSTTVPTEAGVVTEPGGGWYARQAVAATLAAWAGTQGAGTTAVSSGTSGTSSNNAQINYPNPTTAGAQISHWFLVDASSGGNVWLYGEITDNAGTPITITLNIGQLLFFAAGELRITAP